MFETNKIMHKLRDDSVCSRILLKLKHKVQYFGDESSLHGVGYVFSLSYIPFFKRLFWFIMLIGCCFGASAVLRATLGLYSGDLVSFSVETNHLTWDTPFPAVTVCDQWDPDRIKGFLAENKLPASLATFFKEVSFYNTKYCRTCNNCKVNQTCLENFQEYVDKIRLKCTDLLKECWWDEKAFSCCDRFRPLHTEYGVCYSFNSQLTGNESGVLNVNRRIGLPNLVFSAVQPVQIKVHASDDMVSVSMDSALGRTSVLPLISDFEAFLNAEQTTSDLSVLLLSRGLRGCLFKHERPASAQLWPFEDYSYNTCVLYCRATEQMELCNCTHHFMPKLKGIPVCDVQGMACLNKNKVPLLSVDCECPMACEEILYKTVHMFNYRHTDNLPEELTRRGTRATIRLAQLPSLRVRRHAIRGMLGLVVDIGGMGGVFFGASLLSVIEIVYLFCIRRGPKI